MHGTPHRLVVRTTTYGLNTYGSTALVALCHGPMKLPRFVCERPEGFEPGLHVNGGQCLMLVRCIQLLSAFEFDQTRVVVT